MPWDFDEFEWEAANVQQNQGTFNFVKKADNALSTFGKTFSTVTMPAYIQRNIVNNGFAMDKNLHADVLRYFYRQMFGSGNDLSASSVGQFNPDINGFVLIFMIPPDLSGYREFLVKNLATKGNKRGLYSTENPGAYFRETARLATFAAVDFTPPSSQINSDRISSRTGGMPYATEVMETETCSITFIDTNHLDIYHMHHMWIEYIRDILYGWVAPANEYITDDDFPTIDYAASFYVVKYLPNMVEPTFVAKCMGCFPQALPTKELIGTRTSNELTTLPFNYFITAYREATWMEQNHWLFKELSDQVLGRFSSGIKKTLQAATDTQEEDKSQPSLNNPNLGGTGSITV